MRMLLYSICISTLDETICDIEFFLFRSNNIFRKWRNLDLLTINLWYDESVSQTSFKFARIARFPNPPYIFNSEKQRKIEYLCHIPELRIQFSLRNFIFGIREVKSKE